MIQSISFGSKQIDFRLEYSNRKSLGITVTPDLNVLVKAPFDTSLDKVKEKLRKKAPWIIKQQSFFLAFHPKTPARKFISGETNLYLGRQYRLKIFQGKIELVKLKGQFIEVETTEKSGVKKLVNEWYLRNAKAKFHSIAQPLIDKFKKHKVEPSSIVLREMPTRWGSCTPKGKIILNPELIKAPKVGFHLLLSSRSRVRIAPGSPKSNVTKQEEADFVLQPVIQIHWKHNLLISKIKNTEEAFFYSSTTIETGGIARNKKFKITFTAQKGINNNKFSKKITEKRNLKTN